MRVLVTGGAGFIGRQVVASLLNRSHGVVVLDSLRADVHGPNPTATMPAAVDMIVGDVRDPAAVDRALGGCDAVIHLAAKVGLGVSIADLPDYASSNDTGTAQLLAGMARRQLGILTLASSMVVYGEGRGNCTEHGDQAPGTRTGSQLAAGLFEAPCPVCGLPLTPALVEENAPIDPRNAYATSKVAQEFYAANWARSSSTTVAAMRYHNVYGPGMPRDTPYAGVAAIFRSALRHGVAPTVFEDGGQLRDFIHVADVALATVTATERSSRIPAGRLRAFNVGSGTPRTVGELASALARAAGGAEPVVTGQFRLGDVRHITADSARARSELDWAPQVSFASGMAELAAAD
jgi:dTDP-L-rhamnose 4-epimerase